jgi:hypothetical protein
MLFVTKGKLYTHIQRNHRDIIGTIPTIFCGKIIELNHYEYLSTIELIVANQPIYCEHLCKSAYPIINFIINGKQLNQTEFNEKYYKHPTLEPHDYELSLLISQKKLTRITGDFFMVILDKLDYYEHFERIPFCSYAFDNDNIIYD